MIYTADDADQILPPETPVTRRRRRRRRIALLCVAVLVAAVAVWGTVEAIRSCGWVGSGVREVHGVCVGVTDGGYVFDPVLADVEGRIAALNEEVRQREGYVTVALLDPLTPTATSALPPYAERNRLEGAYTALSRINDDSERRPVQLLLANQGSPGWHEAQMDQWRVVRDQLVDLTGAEEGPLVAVIGLGASTTQTREQVEDLSAMEIPTVGSVITADDLESTDDITMLYKTSPSNRHYVAALRKSLDESEVASAIRILDLNSEDDDLFSKTLEEAIAQQLGETSPKLGYPGTKRGDSDGKPSGRFDYVVPQICSEAKTAGGQKLGVYFAGREIDLPEFLKKLSQAVETGTCRRDRPANSSRTPPAEPIVLTAGVELGGVFKDLEEQSVSVVVTVRNAATVYPQGWSTNTDAIPGFAQFADVFDDHFDTGHLADGGAIMVHDSFMVTSEAIELAGKRDSTPVTSDVQDALSDASLTSSGASGDIDVFTDTGLPVGKPIPVLEYSPGAPVRQIGPTCRLVASPDDLVDCGPDT